MLCHPQRSPEVSRAKARGAVEGACVPRVGDEHPRPVSPNRETRASYLEIGWMRKAGPAAVPFNVGMQ